MVVVENDALQRESVAVAIEFLRGGPIPGLCVVEPRQGNCHAINAAFETALAVFPDASGIAPELMQHIAREFNYSETTFVLPPADPSHTAKVRIFTPASVTGFRPRPTVSPTAT